MTTHFPFILNIRVSGTSFEEELMENLWKISERYKVPVSKLSAVVSLLPDPNHEGEHFISAEVIQN